MKYLLFTSVFLFFTLTLSGQTAAEDLRVFPNPVASQFEIGPSAKVSSISVINMVGREVSQFAYTAGERYDIGALPQGMYLVQLRDKDQKVVHTQRIKKG